MNFNQIETAYLPEILRLNNREVPHVNELDLKTLTILCNEAAFVEVCTDEYAISGVIMGFMKGADNHGFNFNWFCDRFDNFLYIDRIFVSPIYKGKGIGKGLYQQAESFCRKNGIEALCCEVNEEPPNPASHLFHQRCGFEPVQSVLHPEGKTVQMYRKLIA
ncbi:GNAT family N-acetyltransferase [Planctobacterium marinum]|uniref:GNAT family N-acetyltransferase n=1 Tax=Planctobacterium marinum TaxID=1631968 RepID=UPI001E3F23D6|nr:GNAT family N-acetyltransferase [Planctobacterium marinum]MCC2603855.1 GNAT family N-acetyltransferase [Planctobacterium marinum]